MYKTGLKSIDKGLKKIRCFKEYKINKVKDVDYNSEQIKAIKNIKNKLNKNIFNVFLLHGVTGSGKTLVYMDIVKDLLKQNKQILILLPEKALSNQISRRFEEFLYGTNRFLTWLQGRVRRIFLKDVFQAIQHSHQF